MKKEHVFLVICAAIFISYSIGLYYAAADTTTAHLDLDSPGYDRIGMHFSYHNQLVNPDRSGVIPIQTLGYPFFLGVIYKLFGHDYAYVIIIQVLLSLLAGWLLYLIAQRLFGKRVALVTAFLFSINLGFLVYSQFILTEVLLATSLLAGLERFFSFAKTSRLLFLIQSGLIFGLSVIVKPVALFYIVILMLFIIVSWYPSIKKIAQYSLLFISCFCLPIVGYMIHNKITYNVFTIAPVMHENIYFYFLAKNIAYDQNIPYDQALNQVTELFDNKVHNDETRWGKPKELMHKYVYNKPFLVLSLWLKNVFKTFCGSYSSQLKFLINPSLKGTKTSFFEKKGTFLERISGYLTDGIESSFLRVLVYWQAFLSVLLYVLLTISFFVLWRSREYLLLGFFGLSIIYFALITGHDGCARYRMMFEGLLILMAAFGLVYLWSLMNHKKIKRLKLS